MKPSLPPPDLAVDVQPYRPEWEREVVALWVDCGLVVPSAEDPVTALHRRLDWHGQGVFVARAGGRLVGAIMAGYEGRRGWLNYLAVTPDWRRRGVGRRLVRHAEAWLAELGCPKVNLLVRQTNREVCAFYERLGYSDNACVSYGRHLPQPTESPE